MVAPILAVSLCLFMTWVTVFRPVARVRKTQRARKLHLAYRGVKIRAIRRQYPALSSMSDREILENYNIHEAYDRIGR